MTVVRPKSETEKRLITLQGRLVQYIDQVVHVIRSLSVSDTAVSALVYSVHGKAAHQTHKDSVPPCNTVTEEHAFPLNNTGADPFLRSV